MAQADSFGGCLSSFGAQRTKLRKMIDYNIKFKVGDIVYFNHLDEANFERCGIGKIQKIEILYNKVKDIQITTYYLEGYSTGLTENSLKSKPPRSYYGI